MALVSESGADQKQQQVAWSSFGMDTLMGAYVLDPDSVMRGSTSKSASSANLGPGRLPGSTVGDVCQVWPDRQYSWSNLEVASPDISHADCGRIAAAGLHLHQLHAELLQQFRSVSAVGAYKLTTEVEVPLQAVLAGMELAGVQKEGGLSSPLKSRAAASALSLSSPKQLSRLLFEVLQLPTEKTRPTNNGYSTDTKVLDSLKDDHPIVPLIIQYKELSKVKSDEAKAQQEEMLQQCQGMVPEWHQMSSTSTPSPSASALKAATSASPVIPNLGSPKQLSQLLFGTLQLPTKGVARTGSGGWSTNADSLEKLRHKHPIVPLILEHRELTKLKGGFVDQLTGLVDPHTSRLHTSYSQIGSLTGRLSSTRPNLQNIPTKRALARTLRSAFVPQEGWSLLSADYSQMGKLRSGPDKPDQGHSHSGMLHSNPTSCFRQKLKGAHGNLRTDTNARSFSDQPKTPHISYRPSSRANTPELATTYMEETRVQAVHAWHFRFGSSALSSLLGNEFPVGMKVVPLLDREASSSSAFDSHLLRAAGNAPIQGTSADILKRAMVAINQELANRNSHSRILLSVHDELILEVHPEETDEVREIVVSCMEAAGGPDMCVPLQVDTSLSKLVAVGRLAAGTPSKSASQSTVAVIALAGTERGRQLLLRGKEISSSKYLASARLTRHFRMNLSVVWLGTVPHSRVGDSYDVGEVRQGTPFPELADYVRTNFSAGHETSPKSSARQISINSKCHSRRGSLEDLKGVRARSWLHSSLGTQPVSSIVGSHACDAGPSAVGIDSCALTAVGGCGDHRSSPAVPEDFFIGFRSVGSHSPPKNLNGSLRPSTQMCPYQVMLLGQRKQGEFASKSACFSQTPLSLPITQGETDAARPFNSLSLSRLLPMGVAAGSVSSICLMSSQDMSPCMAGMSPPPGTAYRRKSTSSKIFTSSQELSPNLFGVLLNSAAIRRMPIGSRNALPKQDLAAKLYGMSLGSNSDRRRSISSRNMSNQAQAPNSNGMSLGSNIDRQRSISSRNMSNQDQAPNSNGMSLGSNVGRRRSMSSRNMLSNKDHAANSNAMSQPSNIISTSSRTACCPLQPTMQHGSDSTSMCGPMPWQPTVQHGGMARGATSKHGSDSTVPRSECAPGMLYGSDACYYPCGLVNVGEEEVEEAHAGNETSLPPVKVVAGTMEGGKGSMEKEEEPEQKKKKKSLFSKFKKTLGQWRAKEKKHCLRRPPNLGNRRG
eukprot:gene28598-31765_t